MPDWSAPGVGISQIGVGVDLLVGVGLNPDCLEDCGCVLDRPHPSAQPESLHSSTRGRRFT